MSGANLTIEERKRRRIKLSESLSGSTYDVTAAGKIAFPDENVVTQRVKLVVNMVQGCYLDFQKNHRKTFSSVMSALAAFSFSTSFMFSKLCVGINGAEVAYARVILMVILIGAYCTYKQYNVFGYNRRTLFRLLIRTCSAVVGSICAFSAVRYIQLSDHTSIQYTAVMFTTIFARLFIKEPFSIVFVLMFATSMLGVLMVSKSDIFYPKPAFNETDLPGSTTLTSTEAVSSMTTVAKSVLEKMSSQLKSNNTVPAPSQTSTIIGVSLSITSAICQSITNTVVRDMMAFGATLSSTVIIYNFSLFSCPIMFITAILMRALQEPNYSFTLLDAVYVFCSAVMGMLAQIFMNASLKTYDASYASLIRGSEIIFSFIYQATIFELTGNAVTYSGIALIVSSMVVINLYKMLMKIRKKKKKNIVGDGEQRNKQANGVSAIINEESDVDEPPAGNSSVEEGRIRL